MRKPPADHEPRWPAVAIWTLTGLLMGLALGIFSGSVPLATTLGGSLGVAWGLFATREKRPPIHDD